MVFSSLVFLCFFLPSVLVLYYCLGPKLRNTVLLLASLFFYAWGEPKFVLIMLLSIVANYIFAFGIEVKRDTRYAKLILTAMVLFNLLILFIFKYLNWFLVNINRALSTSFSVPGIVLPIGISFFTFQAMSYAFDVYYGQVPVQKNPFRVALYISLFPQLVAGPIVRYQTIASQIEHRLVKIPDICAGVCRFTIGLGKKVLLANTLAVIADEAFTISTSELTVMHAWLGVAAYTLQIFFDFSGYSDMAIGLGKMFGFQFEENFNYPYISKSITEFWRRWHISLGAWFRDYVYFPLGGSQSRNAWITIRNLAIVWFLTGLWHGAGWKFIVWGCGYFILICIEKFWLHKTSWYHAVPSVLQHIMVLFFVMLGWTIFRADNLSRAITYMSAMFGFGSHQLFAYSNAFLLTNYAVIWLIAILSSLPIVPKANVWARSHLVLKPFLHIGRFLFYAMVLLACITTLATDGYNPFIYFNF